MDSIDFFVVCSGFYILMRFCYVLSMYLLGVQCVSRKNRSHDDYVETGSSLI